MFRHMRQARSGLRPAEASCAASHSSSPGPMAYWSVYKGETDMPTWGRRDQPRWVEITGNVLAHLFSLVGFAVLASTATTFLLVMILSVAAGVTRRPEQHAVAGPSVAAGFETHPAPARGSRSGP